MSTKMIRNSYCRLAALYPHSALFQPVWTRVQLFHRSLISIHLQVLKYSYVPGLELSRVLLFHEVHIIIGVDLHTKFNHKFLRDMVIALTVK